MTNWLTTETNFRAAIASYDGETVESLKQSMVDAVRALHSNNAFITLNPQVYALLGAAETTKESNRAIDFVYDFADEHRIWIKLPGESC